MPIAAGAAHHPAAKRSATGLLSREVLNAFAHGEVSARVAARDEDDVVFVP
ncbi:MAG: hypothetical protein ACRDQY_19760 [Pseudonocardiaceae bacterium]